MRLVIMLFVLLVAGCGNDIAKPYTIIRKEYQSNYATYYQYVDANDNTYGFYERDTIYHIGDTIK